MAVSFDGAAVVRCKNWSLKSFMWIFTKRNTYVHCFNYQLHLAVLQVIGAENRIVNSFNLCEELYIFLRRMSACALYTGIRLPRLIAQR